MSDQQPPRPTTDDRAAWRAYWIAHNQPWRLEPEIGAERQTLLAKRRAEIEPSIMEDRYPFVGMRLTRADIEWLLATHESGGARGPVDWDDESQRGRRGLDLRGAIMGSSNPLQREDLRYLPLARCTFSLSNDEWWRVELGRREAAAAHLENADLRWAHLEGADLRYCHLEGADLHFANLRAAGLRNAHLEGANIERAILDKGTNLYGTSLQERGMARIGTQYGSMSLADVDWGGANLGVVNWDDLTMLGDEEHAYIFEAVLSAVRHRSLNKFSDKELAYLVSKLSEEELRNLGGVDNLMARAAVPGVSPRELRRMLIERYQYAARANRQLALELRQQGLLSEADRLAYRGQVLQRRVLRLKGKRSVAFGSWLLDRLAGYGFRPGRTVIWYVAVILSFAFAFFLATHGTLTFGLRPSQVQQLQWYEALVLSVSSFHGRGFFQPLQNPGDPVAILAAVEAILGLIIEVSFIATFTQRYFGK